MHVFDRVMGILFTIHTRFSSLNEKINMRTAFMCIYYIHIDFFASLKYFTEWVGTRGCLARKNAAAFFCNFFKYILPLFQYLLSCYWNPMLHSRVFIHEI